LRIERERLEGRTTKRTKDAKMTLPPRLAELEDEEETPCEGAEEDLWPCEVMARCFACEDPQRSPLLLLQRYERSLHNTLMRLMSRLDVLKKRDNRDLYDPADLERPEQRRAEPRPKPAPPAPSAVPVPAPVRNEAKPDAAKSSIASGQAGSVVHTNDVGRRNEANVPRATAQITPSPGAPPEGGGEGSSTNRSPTPIPQNPHPIPSPPAARDPSAYRERGPEPRTPKR
jgi:hypothetical protein